MGSLAQETIDGLEQWSGQEQGSSTERRSAERHACRRTIYLELADEQAESLDVDDQGRVEACTQNISSNGIGFEIAQQLPTDKITICFPQDNGSWLRIAGQIVRLREVSPGVWEYGVKFVRRLDAASESDSGV